MLPMSTTRYVVKCEVIRSPPPVPLGNSKRGLCGSMGVPGSARQKDTAIHMPTELTVVNPFSSAVRRLAAREHVTCVCRGWRGSTSHNTT